jgi:hypothetical protein
VKSPDRRLRERLLSKLIITPSGCLMWTGSLTPRGYGRIMVNGRRRPVHRVMWEMFEGQMPEGLEPDHLCHTNDKSCRGGDTCLHRRCASIAHLEPVTGRENTLRSRSFAASNAAKTHCPLGHPYDDANTRICPGGGRSCRACDRERYRKEREALGKSVGLPHALRTHCPRGHEYTTENTYIIPSSGRRVCRTCTKARWV